ncbi:MAG TPA: UDP-N-acetylmuramate dehydrogenase [Dongiaceae bacterium]|nr:UDP-N-acetylmuramate dehydrogenase [Dongiaceae bacterium]
MDIHTNISLKNMTTMKLGGPARFFAEAHTAAEVQGLYRTTKEKNVPLFILGGGSNAIAHDEGFNGLVLRIKIPGFEVIADDLNSTTIKIGAGESWDATVKRVVDMRLSGIEAMSGIPGTAGAAPVQNVGAYGQDISETLVSLEAYDTTTDTFVTLQNADCAFTYRSSIFREDQKGRYIITSITLKLSKSLPAPPFYDSVQAYFDAHAISVFTQATVRDAVLAIRADKLPDPAVKPSAGSFFKNAIVDDWKLDQLKQTFPDIKAYDMGDGRFKLYTGWLIEHVGLKNQLLHGMRVNEKNCLVLINESAASYADLAAARDEIIGKVRDTFQVIIEQEPLEIPIGS